MFGYIRANKSELKVKEFDTYKAIYCSLCRKLGKNYGFISRLTLSYDFTFLTLLNMSLKEGCPAFERKICAFNPLKKCNYCKDEESLEMPASAAMILLFYKILDNINDEKGFKKIGYMAIKPIFYFSYKKAAKNFPYIEKIVSEYIQKQSLLEKEKCSHIDKAADPTAVMLSKLISLCSEDAIQKRALERMGYCLGRYIYLLDAAVDLEKDIKNNSYNPLRYSIQGDMEDYIKEKIVPHLYFCSNEAALAFELLDIKKYKSILGNIIYLGLEDTFKKELN
ncbi:MAG: hypothetical protein J6J13_05180 [Clostridia bacterium]|nr:hypothetical protein [Clostridia bacterium]